MHFLSRLRLRSKKGSRQPADANASTPPAGAPDLSWFHGREAEVSTLMQLPANLMLVTGHPGVGKSDLLKAAAIKTRASLVEGAVAAPVMLEHRSGTLQCSLLEGLGMALVEFESAESRGDRWAQVFADAAQRTADAGVKDMIQGARGFMIGMVRARLGDEAADALVSFETSLTTAVQEQLSNQIAREADRGAMAAFCLLAERVRELVGEPVVLSLDRAERLGDSDFRMLLDLVPQLPESVHVVVSHTLRSADDDDRVRRLAESATASDLPSKPLNLNGLERQDVEAWMRQRGLQPEAGTATNIDEVMRVTAGYPLHVDLALTAIDSGRSLSELNGDEALAAMMNRNYTDLSADDQLAVMHLCAFSDPPDDTTLTAILGIDASEWTVRQKRLVDARFLVTSVREVPWFHELARRILWEQVLTSNQREESARRGFAAIVEVLSEPGSLSIQRCVNLAHLASLVPRQAAAYPKLEEVLELGRGHLAVLGSLFELIDEEENVAAGAIIDVVGHARTRFRVNDVDLYEASRELADLELVVIAENEENAVLVAHMGSRESHFAAIGRIVSELERVPLPSISRWVLESLLQYCAGFHEANVATGRLSLAQLSKTLKDGEIDRDGDHIQWVTRPGIIFRPQLGDLDFGGGVNFNSVEERDRAFESLSELRSGTFVSGESLDLSQMLKWPVDEPVQSRRFTSAAQHVTGVSFEMMVPRVAGISDVVSVEEAMELTAKTWATLRDLASETERLVLDLDRPRGIGYFTAGEGVLWVEVAGRSDVQYLGELEGQAFCLASRTAFDRGLGLEAGQRMTTMHYQAGGQPKNPVPDLIADTHNSMRAFNEQQRISNDRQRLLMQPEHLRTAILESLDRRTVDAERLTRDQLLPASDRPLGLEVFAVVVPPTGISRLQGGAGDALLSLTRRVDGPNHVKLVFVDADQIADAGASNDFAWFERWFDLSHIDQTESFGVTFSAGWLSAGLEKLLGHDRVSIEFPPGEDPRKQGLTQ